jgi:sulfate transport system ATP-binding protein
MTRSDYTALRERLDLRNGSQVHLKPRRITRFTAGAKAGAESEIADPAAMI